MKRFLLLSLLIPSIVSGANLTGYWYGSGGYKMPRQDLYPTPPGHCNAANGQGCSAITTTYSSWTITRNWDGTTAKMFSGKNETVGGVLYLLNSSGSDATSVSVVISSLTGPGGSGIVSVPVSSSNVWNTTTRPIQSFYVRYIPYQGRNVWYGQEYEARHDPQGGRRPCTVNVNNDCIPSGTWTSRPNHDKDIPDIMVPMELVAVSSFTVAASSSQAIWFDVYVASSLAAGTYTGSITVKEGVVVSTVIPVSLLVYNFSLPDEPTFKSLMNMKAYDINYRHQGLHTPTDVSCSTCVVTRNHYAQMFRAHGYSATSGQDVNLTVDYPSTEYQAHLDGSIYTPAQGYGNARGVGKGDSVYSIGTYSSWPAATWSTSTITGSNGFCTNISSWSAYFATNYPNAHAFVYLQDEPSDFTSVDKWSTWMSTVCAQPSYTLGSFVTGSYTKLNSSAPNVNNPSTVLFYGPNGTGSSAAWAAVGSSYTSTTNSKSWYYNGLAPGTGNMFAHEDDGVSPEVTFWALYKKGIEGYFSWMGAYFTDTNNPTSGPTANGNNDLFNDARTFGYYTSVDSIDGRTGFNYANGDGVLVYPGTDLIFANPNYGFDGPIASWRLKMHRRGLSDIEYLNQANGVNSSATTAIVTSVIPTVLWDIQCFALSSCSYFYGERGWSNDPNVWEVQRESLAQIIASAVPNASINGSTRISGPARMN